MGSVVVMVRVLLNNANGLIIDFIILRVDQRILERETLS